MYKADRIPGLMFESKLPKRINIERLCQHGDRLQGQVSPKELPRLMAIVERLKAPAKVILDFKHDEIGQAVVTGFIEVELELICQRCMQHYTHTVNTGVNWAVVKSDTKAKQLQQLYDPVLESGGNEMELLTQLEDEIILNIPIIPMHENVNECAYYELRKDPAQATADAADRSSHGNPFADLADLKMRLAKQKK